MKFVGLKENQNDDGRAIINLGIINIMPLPALDGGHVLIAIIEGAIQREIPIKIRLGIQQVGMLLLLILFFTIMFNDVQRLMQ